MDLLHGEHQPFIEGILESPDDSSAYLVYADWLEEQGDPRAELMRRQCYLEFQQLTREEYNEHKYRAYELIRQHQREWLGELAEFLKEVPDSKEHRLPDFSHAFRRGFLDEIIVRKLVTRFGDALLNSDVAVFLRRLSIDEMRGGVLVAQHLGGRKLPHVQFPNMRRFIVLTDTGCRNIEHLVARFPRLEHIYLRSRDVLGNKLFSLEMPHLQAIILPSSNLSLATLAQNSSLKSLKRLDITGGDASDWLEFNRAPHLGSLKVLSLRRIPTGNDAIIDMYATGRLQHLKKLEILSGFMNNELLRYLESRDLGQLEELSISGNGFDGNYVDRFKEKGIQLKLFSFSR